MKLKKILAELAKAIIEMGFDKEAREIQTLGIPKIKSGADVVIVSPKDSGKSTLLCVGAIQQLKSAFEKAPRAIIIVENKEKAFELDELFESLAQYTDLRSLIVYDEGNLIYQKDMIYEGIDVLITTPKRLLQLINNSGVSLMQLKMLFVDDAESIFRNQNHTVIHRIADSIDKLQFVFAANEGSKKLDSLAQRVMRNPQKI